MLTDGEASRPPRLAVATIGVILVCVGLFVLVQQQQPLVESVRVDQPIEGGGTVESINLAGRDAFDLEHAAIPCEVVSGEPLSTGEVLVTLIQGDDTACGRDVGATDPLFPDKRVWFSVVLSMFLHFSWLHLGSNVLFLGLFGPDIEHRLGRIRFVVFFLLGGFVALVAQVLLQPDSTSIVAGASGALAALMGAYLVWVPDVRLSFGDLRTLVSGAKWWLAAVWFVVQFFFVGEAGIGWMAHVGGFVYGLVMATVILAVDRRRERRRVELP